MALIQPPTFMQNRSDHTARGDRLGMASVALTSGKSTPDGLLVTQNGTPDMNVLVGPGSVWIHGTNATRQGVYHCVNDGNELVAVSPAHASLQRLDILVAEVRDAFYGGSDNDWQLRVVTGTAGSGSEPAVPASAVRLARITVPASATSITNANITNYHPIAKIGGPLVVENSAERLALVAPDGLMVFERDTKLAYVYDSVGSVWELIRPRRSPHVQVFTSNGTWNKPANARRVHVRMVGGGGGGGGALGAGAGHAEGGGGGAGAYVEKWYDADDLSSSEAVVVGAGGNGVMGGTGQTGGATTFKGLTANGGAGGGTATATTGNTIGVRGIGGTGSGGDINAQGMAGGSGRVLSGQIVLTGIGGSGPFGAGGPARSTLGAYNADGYGAGGGGAFATTTNQAGGNGTGGICIVETYF
jgi:hypothetical protein